LIDDLRRVLERATRSSGVLGLILILGHNSLRRVVIAMLLVVFYSLVVVEVPLGLADGSLPYRLLRVVLVMDVFKGVDHAVAHLVASCLRWLCPP